MDVKRLKLGREYISTKRLSKQLRNHEAKTNKSLESDWVSQLPVDLLCDILSRTPPHTIFSCRCVSKVFLKIISGLDFAKIRNSRLPNNNSSLIIQQANGRSGFLFAYNNDIEINFFRDYCPGQESARPTMISHMEINGTELVGSINGMLCIRYGMQGAPILYICNPILGEFMPLPHARSTGFAWFTAFGFCPKTKKYKVLLVSSLFSEIHTVGTDCWRSIKKPPYPWNRSSLGATCVNGNVYWTIDSCMPSKLICSINLQSEQWEYISPPPEINQDTLSRIYGMIVGKMGGLFCICYVLDFLQLEVFVMKESWYKKLSIDLKYTFRIKRRSLLFLFPMTVLDNGDILFSYFGNSVVYYNSRKGSYRDIAPWEVYKVVDHVSNFISLRDILGTKNVELVQRKKVRFHWSSPDWGVKYIRNRCRLFDTSN